MADILFTHSYFLRFDPKQWKQMTPYAPLGTIYAAALMRQEGFSVALHDVMFSESPKELVKSLEKEKPNYLVIYDDGFNYLTKMCLTNMREAAFKMSKLAKKYGCKVIVCSSDSTDHYEKYLTEGADVVIFGEGEITLLELVKAYENKTPLEEVKGIAYTHNLTLKRTPSRPILDNLDSLPQAAWDLVNVEEYKTRWKQKHGYFAMNMATTRGCPFKCNWCAKPIYGNRYHSRSPLKVADELAFLKTQYGAEYIWFCDDIFGLTPGWVQEYSAVLKERNLTVPFKIQSRVDLLVKENTVAALADAGCHEVWVGAESGSQKVLDAMDKGTKVEEIKEATLMLRKHGIRVAFFLQFGYPGETWEDIQSTFNMLFELMPDDIGVSVSYPLPGTKFYDNVKAELKDKQNWKDSDELALMFRSTYPSKFYRKLQRYVHHEFRKRQALKKGNSFGSLVSLSYRIPQTMLSKARLNRFLR